MRKFERGLDIDRKKTSPCEIIKHGKQPSGYSYEIAIHEGRNRQIRRMMEILDREVRALHRFQYGTIRLGHLKPGQYRALSKKEIERLRGGDARDAA